MRNMEERTLIEEKIQDWVLRISHLYYRDRFTESKETGTYPGQNSIIMALSQKDGMTQREICQMESLRPSTVNVSVNRLEGLGLVEKRTDEKDCRKKKIYLTPAGKNAARKAQACRQRKANTALQGISESERILLKRMLEQILRNMEGKNCKEEK